MFEMIRIAIKCVANIREKTFSKESNYIENIHRKQTA